jgi:hypothetical protein
MDKELYDILTEWVEDAKKGDTLGITILGKHITIKMDD